MFLKNEYALSNPFIYLVFMFIEIIIITIEDKCLVLAFLLAG